MTDKQRADAYALNIRLDDLMRGIELDSFKGFLTREARVGILCHATILKYGLTTATAAETFGAVEQFLKDETRRLS